MEHLLAVERQAAAPLLGRTLASRHGDMFRTVGGCCMPEKSHVDSIDSSACWRALMASAPETKSWIRSGDGEMRTAANKFRSFACADVLDGIVVSLLC